MGLAEPGTRQADLERELLQTFPVAAAAGGGGSGLRSSKASVTPTLDLSHAAEAAAGSDSGWSEYALSQLHEACHPAEHA
jgi:hypothetical protein